MCESIIACVSLILLLPPSFSPLLCFCSPLCLNVMPMAFFMGFFPFFFFSYLLSPFFSILDFHFLPSCSRISPLGWFIIFCFACLRLCFTRRGWPKHPVNLSADPWSC